MEQDTATNQAPTSEVQTTPKQSNFFVTLLSVLLLISCLIAGFFAYQTQNLVKELTVYRLQPTQTPTPSPTTDPTLGWKPYENTNFTFKYPATWKIEENKNLIKIFPVGYIEGAYFTLEKIGVDADSFYEKESIKIGCKLVLDNIMLGAEKNIDTILSFNECNGSNYGYFYMKGRDANVLIRHNFNDAMYDSSVGAILSTFKFIEPEASTSPLPDTCTMEAKICPDGSAVGRSGPKCEFAPCPTPKP